MTIGIKKKILGETSKTYLEHSYGGEKLWRWIIQEKEKITVLKRSHLYFPILLNLTTVGHSKVQKNKCKTSQLRISLEALFIMAIFFKAQISGRSSFYSSALIRWTKWIIIGISFKPLWDLHRVFFPGVGIKDRPPDLLTLKYWIGY